MAEWTILIATIGRREGRFLKLLDHLMPQVEKYKGKIEVLAYWNNFEEPLGVIRQDLVKEATGKYLCFIDDDDWIPDDYCDMIYERLQLDVDYVGFRVQVSGGNLPNRVAHHSLAYNGWFQDNDGFYRDVSHLNPVRRELALQVKFPEMSAGEDFGWATALRGLLKSESYIDKIMYFYRHDITDSTWNGARHDQGSYIRPKVKYKYFKYHSKSKEKT